MAPASSKAESRRLTLGRLAPTKLALGEHVPNRIVFKNYLQARCAGFIQVDAVRVAGVSEFIAVSLLSLAPPAGMAVAQWRRGRDPWRHVAGLLGWSVLGAGVSVMSPTLGAPADCSSAIAFTTTP